ncbi:hypothetical protein [Cryobacterium sp. CG_9.6]|uniref:hypothetical protein n=1 Tax=Cryobacterium sp. CG_9.6 TaxID=2760710 RepID=UPI0024755E9E|nr:hypothetical protein [Cryobacterium sp. CG_9.6]MDH6237554.1 hypothetical protein [Cryobacterium sp. CG_9.6]
MRALSSRIIPLTLTVVAAVLCGNSCVTWNGVASPTGGATSPDLQRATLLVLPDSAEHFATYAGLYGTVQTAPASPYGDASDQTCFGRGPESSCSGNILVGNIWISYNLEGIDVDSSLSNADVAAHVSPLLESIVATVADAPSPAPLWIPPADTAALPAECTGYVTADDVATALGRTENITVGPVEGGGWGLEGADYVDTGLDRCMASFPGEDGPIIVTLVYALPGGAWAYDESSALMVGTGDAETVTTPLTGINRATFGCQVEFGMCTLDTVIGENWVQFSAPQQDSVTPSELRDELIRLATNAASNILV